MCMLYQQRLGTISTGLCCLVLMTWNHAEIQAASRASPGTDQAAPRGHESIR